MADDVAALVAALDLGPLVIAGHSMGGKVAQIAAARGIAGLRGLVLVAPAPPVAMAVPPAQRAAMLASNQSPDGVEVDLEVLAGPNLPADAREQVIADTLAGHPDAKRAWTDVGMVADFSAGLERVTMPVAVIVGDRDQVERAEVLCAAFTPALPQARLTIVPGFGHLLPLEAPDTVASTCFAMLEALDL